MLKGQKKHIDKEQGKTKHEAPRSILRHCDETKKEYSWIIPHYKPELKETTS